MSNEDVGAVQRGQEFFRLKGIVQSPGDIYELDESAKAIYIGPDSDVGEVQVTYFNPFDPNGVETAVVSVNGPLVGRIDSLPITKIPGTGQPARILVSPVDLVDNNYSRPVLVPNSGPRRQFNVPAQIDLMVALKTLPTIPEVRADRTLRYPQVPFVRGNQSLVDDGTTDIIIPIYGRRMVTVQVIGRGVNASLFLVNLTPGGPATQPRPLSFINVPTPPIASIKAARAAVIRASDAARQGVTYDIAGAPTSQYAESDWPPDPAGATPPAFPTPRGMADLLVVNLADNTGAGAPEVTAYADVFVKLADRET